MSPSIRWRLTFWNTLALAVVLLGVGIVVHALLAHARNYTDQALLMRIDRALERVDRSLRAGFAHVSEDPLVVAKSRRRLVHWFEELQEQEPERISGVVFDRAGHVFEKSRDLTAKSLPPAPPRRPASVEFSDIATSGAGPRRILTGPLGADEGTLTLVLIASLADVDRERREVAAERTEVAAEFNLLTTVLMASLPAALLLIAGLGYVLARAAPAPVDQLHRQTEQISADRLDRRLPVANPDDELGRLAQTINAMIGRLERSFAEVRRFTADASHELRTPLTAIRTETEVALQGSLGAEEYRHLLGSILEEIDRLTHLTDQLLSLSREDAGQIETPLDVVDMTDLVQGVAENMRPLTEARGLDLVTDGNGPLPVRGDKTRLRQVFYNLLDNAIKYTRAGGKIDVRLGRADGSTVISVHDTGIGIAPEHLPRVFDRFYRVDRARTRAEGGTGLGLSIARSIIIAHGGRIDMNSALGEGTTCTVILPEAKSD